MVSLGVHVSRNLKKSLLGLQINGYRYLLFKTIIPLRNLRIKLFKFETILHALLCGPY